MENLLNRIALKDSYQRTKMLLEKYYISPQEYSNKWINVQKNIFGEKHFPDMEFNSQYSLYIITSALVFDKEEYDVLRQCLKSSDCGGKYIIIIEDTEEDYPVRLKIPIEEEWDNFTSNEVDEGLYMKVFHFTEGNYYVFNDNGSWGKYVETDSYDVDIHAFLSEEVKKQFQGLYHDSDENISRIKHILSNTQYLKYVV